MDLSELSKLRRFGLAVGTILLSWTFAGVTLPGSATISPLGFPLNIARPELLPLGLALAGAYAALRYFYYAIALGSSPYRIRRDLLDQLLIVDSKTKGPFHTPHTYFGASTFTSTPWWSDHAHVKRLADQIRKAFPKFGFRRVQAKVTSGESMNEDGDVEVSYALDVVIPARCRAAAALQDLDFTAPAWFPLLSIVIWVATRL